MTFMAQFILTTCNLSHDGKRAPGVSATYQQEFIWWDCALGGTRLPDDRPMKSSKEGYLGTIVGSEHSVACIEASWVTCLVNAMRVEVPEETQWKNNSIYLGVNFDLE